jgi:uncharacterized SAM-binding protein YcdF (DUF218 family)
MRSRGRRPKASRLGVVVHGHRDGNAVGGRQWISTECLARLRAAERAAERRGASDVLFCGAGAPGHPSEARQMAAAWRGPRVRLWLDEDSADTAENAQRVLQWTRRIDATQLIVASSWWHVRLTVYYRPFGRLGIAVRQARTRRCDQLVHHLAHELRYLPRALRCGHGLDHDAPGPGPVPYMPWS